MKIFEAGGLLDRHLEGYQERPGQIKMARALQSMLHNPDPYAPNVAIAEGPVGVGKSLAYLFSSLISGDQLAGGSVIVSTSSIALQDQLVNKDLPFVQDIIRREFGKEITFTALKGISNYVCLERFYDNELALDQTLANYVRQTTTGEKPDLVDPREWNLITTDSSGCDGRHCPVFDECFYQKQKRAAKNADVVVVNHALFVADWNIKSNGGKGILPDARFIIIDECHELESSVVNFMTKKLSHNVMKRLYSALGEAVGKAKRNYVLEEEARAIMDEWNPALREALSGLDKFLDWVIDSHPEGLIKDKFDTSRWVKALTILGERIDKEDPVADPDQDFMSDEGVPNSPVTKFLDQLQDFIARLRLLQERGPKIAVYIEGRGTANPSICITDIDVARLLAPLWEQNDKRFVLTSATCSVAQSFDFIRSQLGIKKERSVAGMFDSPFDYSKQAMLIVPNGFDPRAPEFDDQVLYGIEQIIDFGAKHDITKAMILFTSYHQMNMITPDIKHLYGRDYVVLDQSPAMSRRFILEKFQEEPKSILVAQAASYGTGVDIRGNKIIIIVKLNFDVPTEPLFVARKDAIEEAGGDSFANLALPNVIIRTKQQIGRSIRGSDERAIIAIFDGRLNNSRWGRRVLNSLPPMKLWTVDKWASEAKERMMHRV